MPYWARNSDSGSIKVMGEEIGELNRSTLDELRTEIDFREALYDSMTVREKIPYDATPKNLEY
jgi:phospholipid/cholesterol/gamma-HCH transport system ATP-binding protein